MGTIRAPDSEPWTVRIFVNDCPILFCVDSGACVSCVPVSYYSPDMGKLNDCYESISGPDGNDLKILGYINASFSFNGNEIRSKLFVIKGLLRPLLGKPDLVPLKVLQFLGNVQTGTLSGKVNWKQKFPEVFEGLGEIPGSYHIKLTAGAIPFSIPAPRRVALPLL